MDPTSSEAEEDYGASYSEVDASQIPTEPDAKLIATVFGRNDRRHDTQIPDGPGILDEVYPMNGTRRGLAIIFNHWSYKDKAIRERSGADIDSNALVTEFTRLGFETKVCANYALKDIRKELEDVRTMDHNDADCLVIVVMTHGKSSELYAFDEAYPDRLLWDSFAGDKCPSLRGKPKLFFVQACRGNLTDEGAKLNVPKTQTDGKPSATDAYYTVPNTADLLIVHATYDGYFSWRHPQNGSLFIQALCAELNQHGTEYEFLRLMTAVNRRLAITQYQCYSKKQMSTFLSTLTRLLYFPPKEACRGQLVDDGGKVLNTPRLQVDGKPTDKSITYTIPNTADLLIAHATFDGYYAWRNANTGSWFIQALCTELHQHGLEYDILRLMTAVNRRVAINYQSHTEGQNKNMDKKKQMSTVLSTLTRLLYFKPKDTTN